MRDKSHHVLYDGAWKRYRKQYCIDHPFCAICPTYGQQSATTTVDHIKDHKGDQTLFWDPNNHQALCTRCHSIKTAKATGKRYQMIPLFLRGANRGCSVDGTPINPRHHWKKQA